MKLCELRGRGGGGEWGIVGGIGVGGLWGDGWVMDVGGVGTGGL